MNVELAMVVGFAVGFVSALGLCHGLLITTKHLQRQVSIEVEKARAIQQNAVSFYHNAAKLYAQVIDHRKRHEH